MLSDSNHEMCLNSWKTWWEKKGGNACNWHLSLFLVTFSEFFFTTVSLKYWTLDGLVKEKKSDWFKLRLLTADDKVSLEKKKKNRKCFLGKIENIVVKGENAGYQHFLLFT